MEKISINDFKKIELKVATIKTVVPHPNADRLYQIEIDLEDETRQLVAGIRAHYEPDELIGKQVVIVANLEPATIRGVESNGMLLAASNEDGLSLLTLDRPIQNNSSIR